MITCTGSPELSDREALWALFDWEAIEGRKRVERVRQLIAAPPGPVSAFMAEVIREIRTAKWPALAKGAFLALCLLGTRQHWEAFAAECEWSRTRLFALLTVAGAHVRSGYPLPTPPTQPPTGFWPLEWATLPGPCEGTLRALIRVAAPIAVTQMQGGTCRREPRYRACVRL